MLASCQPKEIPTVYDRENTADNYPAIEMRDCSSFPK